MKKIIGYVENAGFIIVVLGCLMLWYYLSTRVHIPNPNGAHDLCIDERENARGLIGYGISVIIGSRIATKLFELWEETIKNDEH